MRRTPVLALLLLAAIASAIVAPRSPLWGPDESTRAIWRDSYVEAYPNGDVYFLIGRLDDGWGRKEYDRYYEYAKWLSKSGFRPIINPVASAADVREAVQNPRTFGIIWSSHGSTAGDLFDSNNRALPRDVFRADRSATFKWLVLSNCNGDPVRARYGLAGARYPHAYWWHGDTTTEDLFAYLFSEKSSRDMQGALGRPFVAR
jgi:hypothetical protein